MLAESISSCRSAIYANIILALRCILFVQNQFHGEQEKLKITTIADQIRTLRIAVADIFCQKLAQFSQFTKYAQQLGVSLLQQL